MEETFEEQRLGLLTGTEPLRPFSGSRKQLHRFFLRKFLQQRVAADIKGHCLEFEEDRYTTRYGGSAVHKIDILHKDDTNPEATIVADLTQKNDIKSNLFDCIICTHVFHIVYELDKIVSELHRILKPGGVLLVSVPHISICETQFEEEELWRFTPLSLRLMFESSFGVGSVEIHTYGNSLVAAGYLRGLIAHDFTREELAYQDPRYALEICARVIKER